MDGLSNCVKFLGNLWRCSMWNSEEMWSNFVEFCEGLEEFSVNLEDLCGIVGRCERVAWNCGSLCENVAELPGLM